MDKVTGSFYKYMETYDGTQSFESILYICGLSKKIIGDIDISDDTLYTYYLKRRSALLSNNAVGDLIWADVA